MIRSLKSVIKGKELDISRLKIRINTLENDKSKLSASPSQESTSENKFVQKLRNSKVGAERQLERLADKQQMDRQAAQRKVIEENKKRVKKLYLNIIKMIVYIYIYIYIKY